MFTYYGVACFVLISPFICLLGAVLFFKILLQKHKSHWKTQHQAYKWSVAFFHPYCNAGGGGERVLWAAVRILQYRHKDVHCVVYTGDTDVTAEHIVNRVNTQFGIELPRPVEFIFLQSRKWVEAEKYPYFTLLLQSLGSIVLALEAIYKFVPDFYFDSMGYAFTFPIFKYLGSCKVACYVHYPTISTDMLRKVSSQRVAHNNRAFISSSPLFTSMKLHYYNMFALLYRLVGKSADVVMVNSSWTRNHILALWKMPTKTFLVYPPCDVLEFTAIPMLNDNKEENQTYRMLSVAQFRPEKDHVLQIQAFHELLNRLDDEERKKTVLVLVGSCRNVDDQERVSKLREFCHDLGVAANVEFRVNISFQELKQEMEKALIALHTMWNEHFGIGVVEGMAAGLVTIAHNSGGPKLDIVVELHGEKTGFLADDITSFADAMETVLRMSKQELLTIQKNARKSAARFSVQKFEQSFLNAVDDFFS